MLVGIIAAGFGKQLRFWQKGIGDCGQLEGIFPTLSIAALVDVTEVDVALFAAAPLGALAVTALAEVTPVPAPPEATSLPPPQEAKAMTEVAQIKRRLIGVFI